MLLNSQILAHATCFAGKVCGPVQSTWGTSRGENKIGARARILSTKVARQTNIPPIPHFTSRCAPPPPISSTPRCIQITPLSSPPSLTSPLYPTPNLLSRSIPPYIQTLPPSHASVSSIQPSHSIQTCTSYLTPPPRPHCVTPPPPLTSKPRPRSLHESPPSLYPQPPLHIMYGRPP